MVISPPEEDWRQGTDVRWRSLGGHPSKASFGMCLKFDAESAQ